MPVLSRGESISCTNPKLDIFTKVSGVPADISSLEFQIFEKATDPNNPIQVFPGSGRQAVNVSAACPVGQKLSTGHYTAIYDVPPNEIIGLHEIRWFFKLLPASPEQQFFEEFDVLSAAASSEDTYITVSDVRETGLNDNPPNDQTIQQSIILWQSFIDRATRQWFRPIELELELDGSDSDALHFGVPIISIDEIRINSEGTALDPKRYKIYNEITYPSNRQNPRIKLVDEFSEERDIFTAPMRNGQSIFRKGRKNQFVKGMFGYVEEDGSAPPLIKRAHLKLVVEKLTKPIFESQTPATATPALIRGLIKEEWTDGHRIRYDQPGGPLKPRAPGLYGITDDPEIMNILRMFKAPIGLATPANPSYR
jgi:hypothetical protein